MRTLFFLLPLAGCLSSDAAGDRWDDWVDEHNSCEAPEDCVVVYPGCPLGCGSAVNADYEDEANDKADDLVSRYEMPGRSCDYDCMADRGADCVDSVCEVIWEEY